MRQHPLAICLFSALALAGVQSANAGQIPGKLDAPNIPLSSQDRVYAAEQFSNTVSVTDPASNRLLGLIRLGDTQPKNLSPLYRGEVLVHGLGFSPDHKTLAVVSIGTNSVTFIDTETNQVKHKTYVGRAPHEAFFTPDGKEVWVTIRGEDYVSVIDATTFKEIDRIQLPAGPGMQMFSPDGKYGYVCSSFNPVTSVVSVADHKVVGTMKQESPFCPNIAVTPDGNQVWITLKDVGKVQVFDAHPPFKLLKTLVTGPITNHVNIAVNKHGSFAYVTVGGTNEVKVYRTDTFAQVATIQVGRLPHGVWISGDGTSAYVGLENDDGLVAIDTLTNKVIKTIPIGQAPQAVAYVPRAVEHGDGTSGLEPLASNEQVDKISLVGGGAKDQTPSTSVSLFNQGLSQVLQASVTGLKPKQTYVLALAERANGTGQREPLAEFQANPAGAAIVNAVGPIRERVKDVSEPAQRRYLVILSKDDLQGVPVQVQAD